jgi:hypothetical protein
VRRAVRAAKPERAPVEATSEAAPAPDGWAELDVKVGNYMEHDARYSGAAVKLPNVSIAAACVRRLSLPPQRYRVLWHGSHGRLAFVPAPRGIVFRPQRSGGVRVICQSLPTLLGRGPKNFRLSESPTAPGAFVELEEVRS